jgi:hypothetical protein
MPTATQFSCVGDCSHDGTVTVDELIKGVNIALGALSISECESFDTDESGTATIDELLSAVNNALSGCRKPSARRSSIRSIGNRRPKGGTPAWPGKFQLRSLKVIKAH